MADGNNALSGRTGNYFGRETYEWTDEAVQMLSELWLAGHSCSEIANRMNASLNICLTRNAVIGKRLRLGLPGRVMPPRAARPVRSPRPPRAVRSAEPKPDRDQKSPRPQPPQKPVIDQPREDSVPWRQRPTFGCQWIFGDASADALCCGRPAVGGPYCAEHKALAFRPTPGVRPRHFQPLRFARQAA